MSRNCGMLVCLFAFSYAALGIPWPLGDEASGWESIYPIDQVYGAFNVLYWYEVDQNYDLSNLHTGIDISASDAGTEDEQLRINRTEAAGGWTIRIPAISEGNEEMGSLERESSPEGTLMLFDLSGRLVWSTTAEAGTRVEWDGCSESGSAVPPGMYLLRWSANGKELTGRLVVTR
jgi:hypothetical protein